MANSRSESGKIIQFVQSISMSHPNIAFELIIDGKIRLKTKGDNSKISIMNQLYSLESKDVIYLDQKKNSYQLKGLSLIHI